MVTELLDVVNWCQLRLQGKEELDLIPDFVASDTEL